MVTILGGVCLTGMMISVETDSAVLIVATVRMVAAIFLMENAATGFAGRVTVTAQETATVEAVVVATMVVAVPMETAGTDAAA